MKNLYKRIKCLLGRHNWKYSTDGVREGTERACMTCDRREKYVFPFTVFYNPWVKCEK